MTPQEVAEATIAYAVADRAAWTAAVEKLVPLCAAVNFELLSVAEKIAVLTMRGYTLKAAIHLTEFILTP